MPPHHHQIAPTGTADPADDGKHITLKYGNECEVPLIAAVHYKNLDGDWTTGGWFSLAPGQTKEVALTKNAFFYVRGPGLGLYMFAFATPPTASGLCDETPCGALEPLQVCFHRSVSRTLHSAHALPDQNDPTPQSYANEKGDPECSRGCWDGEDTVEKFDGR